LVHLSENRVLNIRNENCQGNSHAGVYDDKGNVVEQGVSYDNKSLGCTKKELKVFQTAPGASVYPAVHIVLLKSHHNAEHGDIVVDKQIDKPRQHHYIEQPHILKSGLGLDLSHSAASLFPVGKPGV
jgi:hypothetical protein